jgi:RHS repeat-associated protein
MSNNSTAAAQAINLPQGGGALKGIGETFQPSLFGGTGHHTVPIATSPGRNGFGPELSLRYSATNGNGLFGLGWELSVPRVGRKTEKGLPKYDDTDVFVLWGAEDLVPVRKRTVDPSTGSEIWIPEDPIAQPGHTVQRYRTRTEGTFSRIERWVGTQTGEIHWRTISRDNITNIFGGTAAARIADPEREDRVYEWLLQETFDAFGNHILYEYARDNPALYSGDDPLLHLSEIFEERRRATQLYLRRIYYGTLPDPLVDAEGHALTYPDGSAIGHLREGRRYPFEVVFDYGDWDLPTREPHPGAQPDTEQELFGSDPSVSAAPNAVPIRADRFSSFRAGFDVRTLRRCRRVLMFHHFAELGGPTLVRSTDFGYHIDADTLLSLLASVTVSTYRRTGTASYQSASMPPLTFAYTEFKPHEQRYQSVEARGDDVPPFALDDSRVTLVDAFGDGFPDVVQSGPAGLRYWRNLGAGVLDRPRSLPQVPATVSLAQRGVAFGDMGGDGQADLLVSTGPQPGFFETTADEAWQTFRPYQFFPSFSFTDPGVRLVDLTGKGLSDALMTRDQHFVWFECLGEKGYGPPQFVARKHDLDEFPDVFFDDPGGRVRLADMTGDGLADVVLLHNDRVDYWPNLGYGRFGRRHTMANAPHIEADFDPRRLLLADLNGTGCADLIYVDFDRVHFWFNRCGNAFGPQETIAGTPIAPSVDSVRFADIFGTGTATLVWSYDFHAQPEGNYKALDFCSGVKPYVLGEISNNMGLTTRVSYAPSTRYFLADQADGLPWITRLPFPVQVIDRVEVIDHVSRTKRATTFKYHHGYFDGGEREFRGFGRVDQFDTESFDDFTEPGLDGGDALSRDGAYHVPPVETRTWFHTGIYVDRDLLVSPHDGFDHDDLMSAFRQEFYHGDEEARPLPKHDVEMGSVPHEAFRVLRGAVLRTEVYARDGSASADTPYFVTENRYKVVKLQEGDDRIHGVFFSHQLEGITSHYERTASDPRISHALTLEVDAFGNTRRSIAVGYGRRRPDPELAVDDQGQQARTFITYSENRYTNAIDDPTDVTRYRTPLPSETLTYDLTGFTIASGASRFTIEEWNETNFARIDNAPEILYEEQPALITPQKRVIEHVRTRYRRDNLTGLLPLGGLESLALPGETTKLALTTGLIAQVYGGRVTEAMVLEGGYVHSEGDANWWIPLGRTFFSPNETDSALEELTFARQHFFLQCRTHDAFGNGLFTRYDPYDLLVEQTTDAVGNRTSASHDYRLLQPFLTTDPNGNRTELAFDTRGLVAGTALMGKVTESVGDSLTGFAADLSLADTDVFFADPPAHAAALLGRATTRVVYNLDRFRQTGQPIVSATLARETHHSDPVPPEGLKIQVNLTYSDGFARAVQKKLQASPGPLVEGGPVVAPRWIGSGWKTFNNKGLPVKEHEPFFDDTHEFRFARQAGVSSTIFYDPAERVVATLHPNHVWEKVVFDAWRQENWDVNDTVLLDPLSDPDVGRLIARLHDSEYLPTWHAQRQGGVLGAAEQAAAAKAAVHAGTPTVTHADSLGRSFLTVAQNRFERDGTIVDERYPSRISFTVEGNQRAFTDAQSRVVMRYDYDILSNRIHQRSMESGERWVLLEVTGKPIYAWDSRGQRFHTAYDVLRRVTGSFHMVGTSDEQQLGKTTYGESMPDPEVANLRGKMVNCFDQAGVVSVVSYDFKGNVLSSSRRFTETFDTTVDWLTDPALQSESFIHATTYDALNRPISTTSPDGSVYRPRFNGSNLLEQVHVQLRGADQAKTFVSAIAYNAKGQRTKVEYGNGVTTEYVYDAATFRMRAQKTARAPGNLVLQHLNYTYDPCGNITQVRDAAQQTIYFDNQVVTPDCEYTYDANYRLIAAQGREHIGQLSRPEPLPDDPFRVRLQHPGDGQAMRRYTERYEYDEAGNLLTMIHRAADGDWTRRYVYDEQSLLDSSQKSNRLTRTVVGDRDPEQYSYDEHGNTITLPHLPHMQWDIRDQLRTVDLAGGGTAHYVYDSGGQRVRKVVVRNGGTRVEQRYYMKGFEVLRRSNVNSLTTFELETLHIMDDTQRIVIVDTTTVDASSSAALPMSLTRFQFANHLGSASLELDGDASVISYEEYYPHGSTSYEAVRSRIEAPKRYRYTAMERDEESGFCYHTARYYMPWLGRWSSCDPLGLKDGLNLYMYCGGNPINRIDRFGSDSEWCGISDGFFGLFDDECHAAPVEFVKEEVAPRAVGGLKAAGGLAGMGAGWLLCETGVGCVVGGPLFVASADVGGSGIGQMIYGDPQPTVLGTVAGPEAQAIEEDAVNAAGWAYTFGEGYAMWKTGQPMTPTPRPTVTKTPTPKEPAPKDPAPTPTPAKPKVTPPTIPTKLPGYLSDSALVTRAKALSREVAIAFLRAKGKVPTEAAISGVERSLTVGVLQGHKGGKLVTTVAVQDPKYEPLLRAALKPSEVLVESMSFQRIGVRTGVEIKTGYSNVHSEQVLAAHATETGLITPRVATSWNGCQALCVSNLQDNYPNVRHVNPARPHRH